ncbi:MAG TPA: FG-GAP-like repeat-containing protein [Thermoanaerobaculia bacterium]|nr:FG-GAP-like repeat-containing protein [Thermoanaerobaculia bacterium]
MKKAAVLLLFAAVSASAQDANDELRKALGLDTTVRAIQSLENQRDPKCDATATRLENFMYGTPLSHEGREAKVDLQKKLILGVWKEASKAGASTISADELKPIIKRTLPFTIDDAKNAHVTLADGSELVLEERDVRQYGTVAYALRAILATQQDALLTPGVNLVPLSQDAIQTMKQFVDIYTLAALNLSDKAARKAGQKQLDAKLIGDAWKKIARIETTASVKLAASKPGEVLRKIIDQKLVSFRTYNEAADPLLYSNIQSFYARHPWPQNDEQIAEISRVFSGVVMDFIAEALVRAQEKARAEGSPIVREKHIAKVYEEWAPYTVNIYEDVIFFANLPKEKQIYIEAYDADSLRDSGLHWHLIKQVIDHPSFPLEMDLDPFAAELLAEGDAQIAVLTFRVAGQIAKEKGAPTLLPEHLLEAQKRIAERFAEHLKTKPAAKPATAKLASTSTTTRTSTKFFADATAKSGIDFMHRSSDWLSRFQRTFLYSQKGTDSPDPHKEPAEDVPPAFSGGGVAAEDIDKDGDDDVLIVGGFGNRLYLNNGDGTFKDATEKSGINWLGPDEKPGEPRQPLIADFDNDGVEDIFISYVNAPHRLYKGNGDGTFRDMTTTANLGGEELVGGPAVAFDFDRDGLLDLYIGYYGNYLKGVGPNLARVNHNGTPNKLFKNTGNFTFRDVSAGSGVENDGWTQAVASVDFDLDGWQDLIAGNDFGVNAYYRNQHDGTFVDLSSQLGTDLPSSSMNVGTADLNKDGYPDVYISNIVAMVKDEKYVMPTEETKMKRKPEKLATMRVVQNNHLFTSVAPNAESKLHYLVNEAIDPTDTSTGWAWDADFFDFDNDGDDDLYLVNGLHEYLLYAAQFSVDTPQGRKELLFSVHEREPNVFFVNEKGRLANRSAASGADFSGNSRSAAYLDFDNDGDLDVVVNNFNEKAVVLENHSESLGNHWLKLSLIGDPAKGSNRDAIGARITITTPSGNRIWREVQSATGYLSAHPKEQHVGLGKDTVADVTVVWPGGEEKTYRGLAAGRAHVLKE